MFDSTTRSQHWSDRKNTKWGNWVKVQLAAWVMNGKDEKRASVDYSFKKFDVGE